jgi:phenylalanyl-tRNA synthetase beta chain
MKISLKWIQDYIDVHEFFERPEQLAQLLTQAGLEVEETHHLGNDYKHVVIGLILSKEKHSDAEKLSVCQVATGEGVVHQIICGAKNHKAGDRVIVALPGAILPGNFAIKRAQIRGVDSAGMLCSYKELGLAKESDGIAILPDEATLGQEFATYAHLDDVTFELKVTPNRADCLSHWGLARELSCLLNRPLKKLEAPEAKSFSMKESFIIRVNDPEMCPRYTGRIIRGVKVGPSPKWLTERLERVGLSSINNVVDITNFAMMGFGQPLHAFDLAEIKGQGLNIGRAKKGEKFISLDGTALTLKGEELMIQDQERSLCMAGVIGGKNSGVQDSTQNIFLESAYFAPQFARKSSRSHGITTDSGYRFSRGVDPRNTLEVLNLASRMIVQVAGGEISEQVWEEKAHDFKPQIIEITAELVTERLGYKVDVNLLENWLLRLGCAVEKTAGGIYKVTPPSWRFDLETDMDLVEEYARLNGYEHIPESLPPFVAPPTPHSFQYTLQSHLVDGFVSLGWSQAVNFAFVSEKDQHHFAGDPALWSNVGLSWPEKPVKLINPLNEDMNVMRSTLLNNLLKNLSHNYHHGVADGRLFEVGSVFETLADGKYHEKGRCAGVAWGRPLSLWGHPRGPLVMELKGVVESILDNLGISKRIWLKPSDLGGVPQFLHYGQAAVLEVDGKKLGFIGSIHPILQDELKVRTEICLFELQLDFIKSNAHSGLSRVQAPSKMPAVERDLALVLPKNVTSYAVEKEISNGTDALLKSVTAFDLYEGESLAEGLKSVTYRLTFQHNEITLTEEQIQEAIKNIVLRLKTQLGVHIR